MAMLDEKSGPMVGKVDLEGGGAAVDPAIVVAQEIRREEQDRHGGYRVVRDRLFWG